MKILVTGAGGPAGRNICEILLNRGHQVVATDIRGIIRPGIIFHLVPPAESPSFPKELSRIAQSEQVDMVIPTVSEELPFLARDRRNWAIPLILAPSEAVFIANDKYLTYRFLHRLGLSVPRTVLPSQLTQFDDVRAFLGWPCLSKPRVGRGGRNVAIYTEDKWPDICRLDDTSILQEFISGTEYCPNLFHAGSGQTVTVVLEKLGLKNGLVGNATEVRRTANPLVAHLAEKAVHALGLTGPSDIDIRCRKDGTPVVLEINARFGANIQKAPEILKSLLQCDQYFRMGFIQETGFINRPSIQTVSSSALSKPCDIA